jgi:DNA-binding MurR/RpiR family transcriptional regulator
VQSVILGERRRVYRAEGETLRSLAKSYGVTHPTIMRALRKFEVPISAA